MTQADEIRADGESGAGDGPEAPRRRAGRWELFFHLRVFERGSNQQLGLVIDISEHGLRIGGEAPLEIGHSYGIWMEFPFQADDRARVQFDVEPVWTKRNPTSGLNETGCRITGLLPRARLVVEDLIEELKLRG